MVAEVWKSQLLNISGLYSVGAAGLNNRQKNRAGYLEISSFLSGSRCAKGVRTFTEV